MSKTNNFAKVFQIDENNQIIYFIDTIPTDDDMNEENVIVARTHYDGLVASMTFSGFTDNKILWKKINTITEEQAAKLHEELTKILK